MNLGCQQIQILCDSDGLALSKEYKDNSQNAALLYLIHKT